MTLSERIERNAAAAHPPCPSHPHRAACYIGQIGHVRPTSTPSGMIESPFVRRARENRLPAKELAR